MIEERKLPDKYLRPGKPRACYCLRMAFLAAAQADRGTAMEWWVEAMKAGYIPQAKTKRNLMREIRLAEGRNR